MSLIRILGLTLLLSLSSFALAGADGDGVPDDTDNCVSASNSDQLDTDGGGDGYGYGDICDLDDDDDGFPDESTWSQIGSNPVGDEDYDTFGIVSSAAGNSEILRFTLNRRLRMSFR